MWEENLGTQAGVHLIEGVCLIWGPFKKGFTVEESRWQIKNLTNSDSVKKKN